MAERSFPCSSCGATLAFAPGTTSLTCDHCGTANEVPEASLEERADAVRELDYHAFLENAAGEAATVDRLEITCTACGARTQLADHQTSGSCAFCGSPVVAQSRSVRVIQPRAVLPFGVDKKKALECYERWLSSLWFAPGDLKKAAFIDESLRGVYLPYWTYDMGADTSYTGQRGVDYWVTETYTVTVNGRSETRTRQVRRTRWYPVSGRVFNEFDDVLVPASRTFPEDRLDVLEPWDLPRLAPFDEAYLAGFSAESYSVTLPEGFREATERVQPEIDRTICADIGGDHQRIDGKRSSYQDITFKHVLLPVWITAYRYGGKVYRIIINARTGELSGERPYSAWKIALAVLAGLAVVGVVIAIAASR
jgi:LSD1 subclass zinc finger protein